MVTGRPSLSITDADRAALERLASAPDVARRITLEAHALCLAADGMLNAEIARRCQVAPDTVRRWRRRFLAKGLAGVGTIAPGRGRKSSVTPELVRQVMQVTLHEQPPGGRTWSTRTLGQRLGVTKDTVARIWREEGYHPRGARAAGPAPVGGPRR